MASLSGELGYPTTVEDLTERLRVVLTRDDMGTFVAESNGAVVGWIHMFGCDRLESEPSAEIGGLVVAAGHRGGGIGARLIAAGERWAADHGYRTVRVRSNVIREDAHRFYEREGYVRFKRQAVFEKPLPRPRA